jgi:hypothetical protein
VSFGSGLLSVQRFKEREHVQRIAMSCRQTLDADKIQAVTLWRSRGAYVLRPHNLMTFNRGTTSLILPPWLGILGRSVDTEFPKQSFG